MPRGKRKNLEDEESDHEMSETKSEWIVFFFCLFAHSQQKETELKSGKEIETPTKSKGKKMETVAAAAMPKSELFYLFLFFGAN